MQDINLVQYTLYYLIRSLCTEYTVKFGESQPDRITGDTIFLYRSNVSNESLQLGLGISRYISFIVEVFSQNGVIHGDIVSIISDRFFNAGCIIYDYNPISGKSNFPYDPPDSETANLDYTETVYGWMDFISCNSTDVLDEEIDRVIYSRSVIDFSVNYAKE